MPTIITHMSWANLTRSVVMPNHPRKRNIVPVHQVNNKLGRKSISRLHVISIVDTQLDTNRIGIGNTEPTPTIAAVPSSIPVVHNLHDPSLINEIMGRSPTVTTVEITKMSKSIGPSSVVASIVDDDEANGSIVPRAEISSYEPPFDRRTHTVL